MFKSLIAVLIMLSSMQIAEAQKVTRKGMKPQEVQKDQRTVPSRYQPRQFVGKWQEIRRTVGSKKEVAFSDTLYLNFYTTDSVISRSGMEMSQKGRMFLEGNQIMIAGDDYTIVRFQQNLILDDGDFIRTLERKKFFSYEADAQVAATSDDLTAEMPVSPSALSGKWEVYRTRAKPGLAVPDSAVIRGLEFFAEATGLSGNVSYQQKSVLKTLPANIKIGDKILQLETEEHQWLLRIYKNTEKELIFGNRDGIVYYARKIS